MSDKHHHEPRNVGYSKDNSKYYQDWTSSKSNTIFSGMNQSDLFLFAMGLGRNRNKKSDFKNKINNINVASFKEDEKWALLSIGLVVNKDIICLKDELPIYSEAEKYAEEGIKILNSHMEKYGLQYPKALEAELKEILKEK